MIVTVLSKMMFDHEMNKRKISDENVTSFEQTCFISISGTCGADKSHFNYNHDNVLRLYFDDVEEQHTNLIAKMGLKLFDSEMARQVISFIEKNKDKKQCIVHCHAGVSRSGAIGTFINDNYGEQNYFEFIKSNPNIKSNGTVSSILKRVYNECDSSCQQ